PAVFAGTGSLPTVGHVTAAPTPTTMRDHRRHSRLCGLVPRRFDHDRLIVRTTRRVLAAVPQVWITPQPGKMPRRNICGEQPLRPPDAEGSPPFVSDLPICCQQMTKNWRRIKLPATGPLTRD